MSKRRDVHVPAGRQRIEGALKVPRDLLRVVGRPEGAPGSPNEIERPPEGLRYVHLYGVSGRPISQ